MIQQTDKTEEIRDLKTLYILLLDVLKLRCKRSYFICCNIDVMHYKSMLIPKYQINAQEYNILIHHFHNQRPTATLYPDIYNNKLYDATAMSWFQKKKGTIIQDLIDIRIELLNQIIATL